MKRLSSFLKILPIIIVIFSFFLYLFKITNFPPSLFSDEADLSYQAFVFNNRGTDYFGNKNPTHFHSFSDWRTSASIYSVVFSQKIFGYTDFATRFPSALFGALSVLVFYLILKRLIEKKWATLGSFLFAITPWLFHYSRVAFEATGMLLFLLLALYFWILFLQKKKDKFIFLSAFSFIITIYFYSTAKLFLILIAISMALIWFKKLIKIPWKKKILLILLILLASTPFIVDFVKGKAGYRFSYISIFTDPTISKTVDHLRYEDSVVRYGSKEVGLKPMLQSKIFHNKISQYSEIFIKNYFSAFSTEFLFLKGDGNLRQGFNNSGNLLFPDLLLILIGISLVFAKKIKEQKIYLFFLFLLCFAPIPFSLTRDSIFPHSTRLILMLPFLSIFSILGLRELSKITKSKTLIIFITLLYLAFFSRFIHQYQFHYPNLSARSWHFGMKEAVLSAQQHNSPKTYFIDSYEPFLPFFLNYSQYLPSDEEISPAQKIIWDNNQFFTGRQINNKYFFGIIEWSPFFNNFNDFSNTIFITPQKELIRLENSLKEYNRNYKKNITFEKIEIVEKKYTEQELIYLIKFKSRE